MQLRVNDIFGPTIQGEGPYMGHTVNFIRLGLCNLHCTNCDTAPTWDSSRYDLARENPWVSVDEIVQVTEESSKGTIVVISGGEPLLQQDTAAFRELLRRLVKLEYDIHIETNGTRLVRPPVADLVTHFSVSPKLTGALISPRDEKDKRIKMGVLKHFANYVKLNKACFKFVCATPEHVEEVDQLRTDLELWADAFWIMPEGQTAEEVERSSKLILPATMEYGFCFTPRLHILTGLK